MEMKFQLLGIGFLLLAIAASNVSAEYGDLYLAKCQSFDDCRATCGPSATHLKCHKDGYCACLNLVGYPVKCESVNTMDEECSKMCGSKRIPKRCQTDAGLICTCFQHPYADYSQ